MPKHTKAILTFEDTGKKSVTQTFHIEQGDNFDPSKEISNAVIAALTARILFKTGIIDVISPQVVFALANDFDPSDAAMEALHRIFSEPDREDIADGGDTP